MQQITNPSNMASVTFGINRSLSMRITKLFQTRDSQARAQILQIENWIQEILERFVVGWDLLFMVGKELEK